jgi:hypothetical protein
MTKFGRWILLAVNLCEQIGIGTQLLKISVQIQQ